MHNICKINVSIVVDEGLNKRILLFLQPFRETRKSMIMLSNVVALAIWTIHFANLLVKYMAMQVSSHLNVIYPCRE